MRASNVAVIFVFLLSVFLLPEFKNALATMEIRGVDEFEATLVRELPAHEIIGPIKLTPAQRESLVSLLDWDYIPFGRSFKGIPSCVRNEAIEFRPAGGKPGGSLIVSTTCGGASFSGRVKAYGWSMDSRNRWKDLRDAIFPGQTDAARLQRALPLTNHELRVGAEWYRETLSREKKSGEKIE